MTSKNVTLSPELDAYYCAHACREPDLLKELREETVRLGARARMQVGPEQGAFMGLLARLMDAKSVVEFGTFTGYSSLAMAYACNATFTCIDVSEEWTAVAKRYWARAGFSDRMTLRFVKV